MSGSSYIGLHMNGARIRSEREFLGMTQEDLARCLIDTGYLVNTFRDDIPKVLINVQEAENGTSSIQHGSRYAKAFEEVLLVPQAWLFGGVRPEPPRRREAVLATREKYK